METTSSPNSLQQLILSLSAREKSHLKKMIAAKTGRERTLSLKLFELLEKENGHSTAHLLQELGIKSKTQLSGLKTGLFSEILDMKVYDDRKENINSCLHIAQEQIVILFQKGMFDAAEKLCQKVIGVAKKYAKYQFLTDLLYLQNNAIQYKDYKKYKAINPDLFENIKSAIQHQHALVRIRLLFEQIRVLGYRTWLPIEEKELALIRNMDKELNSMNADVVFRNAVEEEVLIKLFYLNTKALCSYLLHEKHACSVACEEALHCWKKDTHLIAEYARLFLHSVNVTSYHDFFMNNIHQAAAHLNDYSALANKHLMIPHYYERFQIIHFNTSLKIFHKTAQYDQVKHLVNGEGKEILKLANGFLPDPDILPVFTSICISYFVLGEWDEAESMLMKTKDKNYTVEREDILYFNLVFHLLILYEKKEWYRLDSAIEAAYHFLYSRKKLRIFEREMMLFLKRLALIRDMNSIQKACAQFLQRLQRINEKDIPLYSLYFNFPGWIESKIEGISYVEYVKQKVNVTPPG
jgi:hypothetical protein